MRDAWEQVKEMRGREEEAHQRAAFLAQGLAMVWKEGVHTDIVVKPGAGPPIPAHKAILVSKWAAYWLRTSGPSFPACISNEAQPAHEIINLTSDLMHTHARRPRGRRCSATCWPPTSAARPPPATPSPSRSGPTTSSPSSSPSSTPARWRTTAAAAASRSRRSGSCTRSSWRPTSTMSRSCGGPVRRGWRRPWTPPTCCARWRSQS